MFFLEFKQGIVYIEFFDSVNQTFVITRCYITKGCIHDTFVKEQPNIQVDGKSCSCWIIMARLVHVYLDAISRSRPESGSGSFVRLKERFLITDDWTIKPASSSTILSLIQKFSSDAVFHGFEEVQVSVSWKEVILPVPIYVTSLFSVVLL
jgi:hypothetical protein